VVVIPFSLNASVVLAEVVDSGPRDHGAFFQFLFNEDLTLVTLEPGETFAFKIYYGGAATKVDATLAIQAVSAEVSRVKISAQWHEDSIIYTFHRPLASLPSGLLFWVSQFAGSCDTDGSPNSFIFGFSGVGGLPIVPPSNGGGEGDPHFKTWRGQHFDFHGECDLVLLHCPAFESGLGLDVHIRTKIRHDMSYISSVALRISSDVLEVESQGVYYLNGVVGTALPAEFCR
jgi:hypothetical protein